jgi:hypothetical protein
MLAKRGARAGALEVGDALGSEQACGVVVHQIPLLRLDGSRGCDPIAASRMAQGLHDAAEDRGPRAIGHRVDTRILEP